ncbi:MAG: hypothetical protein DRI32_00400 [Chloroflexi bacterium]|nr:MAG: hypothetical protein DRI32_00400 [Chloroflexota bacterium]
MTDAIAASASIIWSLIDTAGSFGVLLFFVVAFYRGDVIPKSVVNDIVSNAVSEIMFEVGERIDNLEKAEKEEKKGGW